MSKAKDRRERRREAAKQDQRRKEEGEGFKTQMNFIVGADELDELGISAYRPTTDDDRAVINKVHILPSNEEDAEENLDVIALALYIHRDVGADGLSFLCPKWMRKVFHDARAPIPDIIADGKCPVCEEHERVLKRFFDEKNEDRKNELYDEQKDLRAFSGRWNKPRPKKLLAWVRDAINEEAEEEAKFWIMPPSIYDEGILEQIQDEDNLELAGEDENGVVDIVDPDDGFIFQFKVEGKGYDMYKAYKLKKRKFSITQDEPDWLNVPRYKDLLVFHDYDTIAEALHSSVEEEEEKPRRGRRKKAIDQAAEDWDEDEAAARDAEDDEDERPSRRRKRRYSEDDEDEKPRRSRRSHKAEDDEDEKPTRTRRKRRTKDEDDEEEKPRQKRRRRSEPEPEDDEDEDDAQSTVRSRAKKRRRRRKTEEDD